MKKNIRGPAVKMSRIETFKSTFCFFTLSKKNYILKNENIHFLNSDKLKVRFFCNHYLKQSFICQWPVKKVVVTYFEMSLFRYINDVHFILSKITETIFFIF